MDLNDFWQENKRLLLILGCGLLLFWIANAMIEGTWGEDLGDRRAERSAKRRELESARYAAEDRSEARAENDALLAALGDVAGAVAFRPRPDFVVDPARGSAGAQYFTRLEEVREGLSMAASRARMIPPDDAWGIEALQTNILPLIERHLEALDMVDRLVRLAIDAGVQRVDRLQVSLDPGYDSREGLGRVERTSVSMALSTSSQSLTRFVRATQTDAAGQVLPLGDFAVKGHPSKFDEVKADLRFLVVRLHDLPGADEEREVDGP